MELELGLKLKKIVDDFNFVDLSIAKDRAGPVFLSHETNSMFVLTAHLKGYRRKNIKIDINEDGSRIAISGEKPVQETVMVGWRVVKKETEMRGFRKVFKIPSGVVLDNIKASFNEEDSMFKISMPKLVKGVTGLAIEEVKEEGILRGATEPLVVADEVLVGGDETGRVKEVKDENIIDKLQEPSTSKLGDESEELDPKKEDMVNSTDSGLERIQPEVSEGNRLLGHEKPKEASKEHSDGSTEEATQQMISEPKNATQQEETRGEESNLQAKGPEKEELNQEKERPIIDQAQPTRPEQLTTDDKENRDDHILNPKGGEEEEKEREAHIDNGANERTSKICTPIIVGSALLVSLVVFVFHLIRTKKQTTRKSN